jgi:hypothetical protein
MDEVTKKSRHARQVIERLESTKVIQKVQMAKRKAQEEKINRIGVTVESEGVRSRTNFQ